MNEAGLMVEIMWLDSSQYPAADSRPALNELQFIQYALDGYASLAELVPATAGIRVVRAYANVHYLVCDATSECAAFEYIDGELVVTRSVDMPAKTLANDTYENSAAYLAGFQGFGGTATPSTSSSSLDRFVRASSLARTTDGTTIPASAFQILESAAQISTQWSIVYLPKQSTVHFRTKTMPKLKSVNLTSFSVDCPAKRRVLDIDIDATGDASAQFVEYTVAQNRQLVTQTMSSIASSLPSGAAELVVGVPDTYTCVGAGNGNGAGREDAEAGCACDLPGRTRAAGPVGLLAALGLIGISRKRIRRKRRG